MPSINDLPFAEGGTISVKKGFAKIRHHVPIAIIHQAHHLPALVSVLADRNIQVRHVAIERRVNPAKPARIQGRK
jgi:hypothetical protein